MLSSDAEDPLRQHCSVEELRQCQQGLRCVLMPALTRGLAGSPLSVFFVLLFICLSVLVHLSSWEVVLVLLESFWVLGDEDLK